MHHLTDLEKRRSKLDLMFTTGLTRASTVIEGSYPGFGHLPVIRIFSLELNSNIPAVLSVK